MPVSAEFVWTPPGGSPTTYVVELYETHVAEVRERSTDDVVVHSPRWDATRCELVLRSGHGPAYLSDRDAREGLFGAATEALRSVLLSAPFPSSRPPAHAAW